MKGFLHKNENDKWTIKWSDLHSFAQGTHWMYTELHPESISSQLEDNKKVDFIFIADDIDPFNYKYAKIIKPKNKKNTNKSKIYKEVIEKVNPLIERLRTYIEGGYMTEEFGTSYWTKKDIRKICDKVFEETYKLTNATSTKNRK